MDSEESTQKRLADLLFYPREDLGVEMKGWLDLNGPNNNRLKAKLARAIIAMANHGGGHIVLGYQKNGDEMSEAEGRPHNLEMYNQDLINGIVEKYCDPPFQCAVRNIPNPQRELFPIITVPGGHKVPVRATKSGPDGSKELKVNAYYIRRLGPKSEEPQTSNEWDELLERCMSNRCKCLLDQRRDQHSGDVKQINTTTDDSKLDEWIREGYERWQEKIKNLPDGSVLRLPHGHYCFAYEIVGKRVKIDLADLQKTLKACEQPFTGWPLFLSSIGKNIGPTIVNDSVECWLGGDERGHVDAAHSDFWRFHRKGRGFVLRGYHIDCMDPASVNLGSKFYLGTPIWRVGEALLHARAASKMFFDEPEAIRFVAMFTGLKDRELANSTDGGRHYIPIGNSRVAEQDKVILSKEIEVGEVDHRLPEVVHSLLKDLYAYFGFYKLGIGTVNYELNRMIDRV